MRVLSSDGEKGMRSMEASEWAENNNIELKFKAPGQKCWVVERHHEILRRTLHTTETQLMQENVTVPFEQVLASCVATKNALTVVGTATPYQALYGRNPIMLPPMEGGSVGQLHGDGGDPDTLSRHQARVREVACAAIIEASAHARLQRAQRSKTRHAADFETHARSSG